MSLVLIQTKGYVKIKGFTIITFFTVEICLLTISSSHKYIKRVFVGLNLQFTAIYFLIVQFNWGCRVGLQKVIYLVSKEFRYFHKINAFVIFDLRNVFHCLV